MIRYPLLCWLSCLIVTSGCTPTGDGGDVRQEARLVLQLASTPKQGMLTTRAVLDTPPPALPVVIRVWRRTKGGSARSCDGTVEEIPLEQYVAGVLPNEWMAGWDPDALDAGAIAIRTYGSFWAQVGGRYACADVDDTTWSQVYSERRHPATDAAVQRTEGTVLQQGPHLVYAEYSAELGKKTRFGVEDPVCAGKKKNGHGRGLCQWGSQRWAEQGRDAAWILTHYFPGTELVTAHLDLTDGVDLNLYSGTTTVLTLEATNPGPQDWPAERVHVGTEPSAFATDDWLSPTRPAALGQPLAAGERATVSFSLRAPIVTEPTHYEEYFWLEGATGPGTEGTWRITVHPPVALPVLPERSYWWAWAAGFVAAILLVVLALRARDI